MAFREREKLELKIRQTAINSAKAIGLSLNFPKGRRQSDILLIKVSGKCEQAYAVLNHLKAIFPEIDIDILKINSKNSPYNFILVVTEKIDEQNMVLNERRSKLIVKLAKLKKKLQDLNGKPPPSDFSDLIFLENF